MANSEKQKRNHKKTAKQSPARNAREEGLLSPLPLPDAGADDDIDLERVIYDPEYRRWALWHLNTRRRPR